jgi:hypothetical protein
MLMKSRAPTEASWACPGISSLTVVPGRRDMDSADPMSLTLDEGRSEAWVIVGRGKCDKEGNGKNFL